MRAALVVAVVLLLAGCGSEKDSTTTSSAEKDPYSNPSAKETPAPPQHGITVKYAPPANGDQALARKILRLGGTDGVAAGFSKTFNFPVDLKIVVDPGEEGPYYDPSTRTVHLSYGFANTTANILQQGQPDITETELGKQWAAVNDFFLIHELGHAFVDVFDIPITGREEDSVDGLATVFFTDQVDGGAEYAFDAARFFDFLQTVQGDPNMSQFKDEHSLSVQRAFDVLCAIAGSSDESMQNIAALGVLPKRRLARCPAEYEQKSSAWETLLKPHLRTSG